MGISRRKIVTAGTLGSLAIFRQTAIAKTTIKSRFNIEDYGATGDGITINTAAIQRAIDACFQNGGGEVVIPAGIFLSGSIFLRKNVHLKIERNGVLRGSSDLGDYPLTLRRFVEVYPEALRWALVNARNCDGLRISGPGTLEGAGEIFWKTVFERPVESIGGKEVRYHLPQTVFVQDSQDVVISGMKFMNSGFWNTHLYRCRQVIVEHCRFEVPHRIRAPSSDGVDIDSCQDVTVRHCYFSVDDDCIVLKGTQGLRAKEFTEAPPVERVHIHDCEFAAGLGGVVFGTNATTVRDIRVENCLCSGDQPMIRFKLRPDTPGQVFENVHVTNIRLYERETEKFHGGEIFYDAPPPIGPDQGTGPLDGLIVDVEPVHGVKIPPRLPADIIRNLVIENVTGTTEGFGNFRVNPFTKVSNVRLANIDVTLTKEELSPIFAEGVENLTIKNVKVNNKPVEVK
jgi:polygalacturonase